MTFLANIPTFRRRKGRQALPGPYRHEGGLLWATGLILPKGDDEANYFASNLCLYEKEQRLTAGHCGHPCIRLGGGGCYIHSHATLYFSTRAHTHSHT